MIQEVVRYSKNKRIRVLKNDSKLGNVSKGREKRTNRFPYTLNGRGLGEIEKKIIARLKEITH